MDILIVVIYSYTCGSIPFGLILTKIFTKKDVRKVGSGNIGATNVLRIGNKFLAALTLILDILKGYLPVIISQEYFPEFIQLLRMSNQIGTIRGYPFLDKEAKKEWESIKYFILKHNIKSAEAFKAMEHLEVW